MKLTINTEINAPVEAVWQAITDIDQCAQMIGGIKSVNVLDKPQNGVVGLKWQETREMFGKEAVETMWITDAEENVYYATRAENCGSIYTSKMRIEPLGEGCRLSMDFSGEAQTFFGKLMSLMMGWLFAGSMKKMMLQDLEDIKTHVERQSA